MSWNSPLGEAFLTSPLVADLRRRLHSNGYTEDGLSALLGFESPAVRSQESREHLIWRLRESNEPPAPLARLFFLGDEVARRELSSVFGADEIEAMIGFGVLAPGRENADAVRALVGITPCRDVLVISDPLAQDPEAVHGPGGPSMGPGADTETLLRTTPRDRVGRVLDLCTGPGTHALAATRHAEEVIGLDIAQRALSFARAGAALNGTTNARFVHGDISAGRESDGVPGGQYDLVLANPPFVPNIHNELLYRDGGGPLGDEVLNAVIGRLEDLLAPGGQARVITDVAFRAGETLESKMKNIFGSNIEHFDIIGFEDPPFDLEDYTAFHSVRLIEGRMVQESAAAEALHAHYRRIGISRVAAVLIAFRRTRSAGRRLFRRVSTVLKLACSDIDRVFALWAALRQSGPERVAMDVVPTPRRDLSLVHRKRLTGDRGEAFQIDFGERSPWPASRTNAQLYDLLWLCDGKRTGREVADTLSAEAGLEAGRAEAFVIDALVSLAEVGAIDLVA